MAWLARVSRRYTNLPMLSELEQVGTAKGLLHGGPMRSYKWLLQIGFLFGSYTFGQYAAPVPVFSQVFGGASGSDAAASITVDPSGNVAVVGTTGSPDFPVVNAAQPNAARPA